MSNEQLKQLKQLAMKTWDYWRDTGMTKLSQPGFDLLTFIKNLELKNE